MEPKPGERVELISTDDEHTLLRPGARGTVALVDDLGTLHVRWDDGSRLGLVPGRDRWRIKRGLSVDEEHGEVRTWWEEAPVNLDADIRNADWTKP